MSLLCIEESEDDDGSEEVEDGVGDHHVLTACTSRLSPGCLSLSLSLTWGLLIEGDAAPGGLLQSLVIVDQIVHLKQSVRIRIDFSYLINLDTTHTTTQPNLNEPFYPQSTAAL